MSVSWMKRGVAAPKLPSLMRNTAVLGEGNRLTAWMREDPDLVHSDVARMTFQRDGFKYHLQYTQAGSQFHRSGCRHWSEESAHPRKTLYDSASHQNHPKRPYIRLGCSPGNWVGFSKQGRKALWRAKGESATWNILNGFQKQRLDAGTATQIWPADPNLHLSHGCFKWNTE